MLVDVTTGRNYVLPDGKIRVRAMKEVRAEYANNQDMADLVGSLEYVPVILIFRMS